MGKELAMLLACGAAVVLATSGACTMYAKMKPAEVSACKEAQIVQSSLQICASVQTDAKIPVCVITPADFERALRLKLACDARGGN